MATLADRQSSGSACSALCGPPPLQKSCCVKLSPQIIHDPDPSIYTQQQIATAGSLPSYDNPDVDSVNLWPVSILDPINARVRNLSPDASANQTRVDISWSQWGIGMPQQVIGTAIVDLARAGLGGSQKQVSLPLPQAAKDAGRYGIFVRIYHPYDRDNFNNLGEQVVDGFRTSQGRSLSTVVPVRNPTAATQTVVLQVGPAAVASWVNLAPSTLNLGPGAQANVALQINVPAAVPVSPPGTLVTATMDILATLGGSS